MYIYPNTTLKILRGVNLNSDNEHTIFFSGKVAQTEYFLSKAKYTLSNQSYQRKERGWIQVDINQNNLWDCTYLMYQNTSYSNKWFYAFILSVDYVNDSVSKIHFEIDVLQTWHFDYTLDECFIEREHTDTDNLFENTINENLDIGDYYNAQVVNNFYFNSTRLCAPVTEDAGGTAIQTERYKNCFSGLFYISGSVYDPYDSSDPGYLDGFYGKIDRYISRGKEDAVVSIFQYPNFIGSPEIGWSSTTRQGDGYAELDYSFTGYNFTNVDGYVPKNKKLFCFPYNYLSVSDKEGNGIDLKWELWNSSHIGEFEIDGCIIGKPSVVVYPKYYRDIVRDRDTALTYDNFPICAWTGDSYQVWLAQHKGTIYSDIMNLIAGGAMFGAGQLYPDSYPSPQPGVAMLGGFTHITRLLGTAINAQAMPDKMHGGNASSLINIQNESSGFEFKQMTIRREYAVIIDHYFSKYGYACHRVKVPNRNARQNWTYTKTVDCEISGNVPSDDIVKLKSIYNNGITFWNNPNLVGHYGDFTNPVYS